MKTREEWWEIVNTMSLDVAKCIGDPGDSVLAGILVEVLADDKTKLSKNAAAALIGVAATLNRRFMEKLGESHFVDSDGNPVWSIAHVAKAMGISEESAVAGLQEYLKSHPHMAGGLTNTVHRKQ